MIKETANNEVQRALAKLEQAGTSERQQTVALCAEKADQLGARFFCEVMSRGWDPTCTWYAIRALGDLGAKEYCHVLLEVLRHPDVSLGASSLHRVCARSIGLLGGDMLPLVARLLENSEEATRAAAADALGEIGHPAAIPILARCLVGEARDVQLWAALSLAKIGNESIPALIDALKTANKEETLVIVDALVRIGDTRVIDGLIHVAEQRPDVLRFFFSRDGSKRGSDFLKMLRGIPPQAPLRKKADKILAILK